MNIREMYLQGVKQNERFAEAIGVGKEFNKFTNTAENAIQGEIVLA